MGRPTTPYPAPTPAEQLDIPSAAEHRAGVRARNDGYYQLCNQHFVNAVAQAKTDRVQIPPPSGVPYKIREEVMQAWRDAGWKVTFQSDQREGDWVTISA